MVWFDTDWDKKKPITLSTTPVESTQSNIPVMFRLTSDSDLAAHAKIDGSDILFTNADEDTQLAHDIVKFDESTGELIVYVKIPSLSSLANTVIYMYYDNPSSTDQNNGASVWSDYAGVWYLQESGNGTAGEFIDASGNGADATSAGTSDPAQTAHNNGLNAQDFNGSDNAIDTGTVDFAGQSAALLMIWANHGNTVEGQMFGQRWGTFSWMQTLDIRQKNTTPNSGGIVNTDTNQGGQDGELHTVGQDIFWCQTWDSVDEIFHNYSLDTGNADEWSNNTATINGTVINIDAGRDSYLGIGDTTRQNGSSPFDGLLWLARASFVSFSEDYIRTTAQIESDPSGWASAGTEETAPSGGGLDGSTTSGDEDGGNVTPELEIGIAVSGGDEDGGSVTPELIQSQTVISGDEDGGNVTPELEIGIAASGGDEDGGSVSNTISGNISITVSGGDEDGSSVTSELIQSQTVISGDEDGSSVSTSGNISIAVSGGDEDGNSVTPELKIGISVSGGDEDGGTVTPELEIGITVSGGDEGGGSVTSAITYSIIVSGGDEDGGIVSNNAYNYSGGDISLIIAFSDIQIGMSDSDVRATLASSDIQIRLTNSE